MSVTPNLYLQSRSVFHVPVLYIQLSLEISIWMTHWHLKPESFQYQTCGVPTLTMCLSPGSLISVNGSLSPNCSCQKSSVKGEASLSPSSPVSSHPLYHHVCHTTLKVYLKPSVSLHLHCYQPNPETANRDLGNLFLPTRLLCFDHSIFF